VTENDSDAAFQEAGVDLEEDDPLTGRLTARLAELKARAAWLEAEGMSGGSKEKTHGTEAWEVTIRIEEVERMLTNRRAFALESGNADA